MALVTLASSIGLQQAQSVYPSRFVLSFIIYRRQTIQSHYHKKYITPLCQKMNNQQRILDYHSQLKYLSKYGFELPSANRQSQSSTLKSARICSWLLTRLSRAAAFSRIFFFFSALQFFSSYQNSCPRPNLFLLTLTLTRSFFSSRLLMLMLMEVMRLLGWPQRVSQSQQSLAQSQSLGLADEFFQRYQRSRLLMILDLVLNSSLIICEYLVIGVWATGLGYWKCKRSLLISRLLMYPRFSFCRCRYFSACLGESSISSSAMTNSLERGKLCQSSYWQQEERFMGAGRLPANSDIRTGEISDFFLNCQLAWWGAWDGWGRGSSRAVIVMLEAMGFFSSRSLMRCVWGGLGLLPSLPSLIQDCLLLFSVLFSFSTIL